MTEAMKEGNAIERPRRHRPTAPQGFSVVELVVTTAIIMVLASLSIAGAVNQWRSEQTYAVAEELAGWIATVQRAAMRGRRCDITIAAAGGSLGNGQVLAVASQSSNATLQNSCTAYSPLLIEAAPAPAQFTVTPTGLTFSFTPRGTIANNSSDPVVITVTNVAGGAVRCIRLDGLLGFTRVGVLQGSTCQI